MPRPTPPDARVLARRRAVGEQIRHVREHHNLTQQAVCSRSGIDVATYSRIEQGHASPKLDTLIRIADAIGVDLEKLVAQGGNHAHPQRGERTSEARFRTPSE